MNFGYCINRVGNRLQSGYQTEVASLAKAQHPVFGHGLAGARLDQDPLVFDCLANKDAHAFSRRQRPAGLLQHVAQHAVGDGLAVNQHAIAIK
jgi:hypothetical protein